MVDCLFTVAFSSKIFYKFQTGFIIDFLIGEGENASYDKETVDRINDIQKMDNSTKSVLFNVINTYIQNFKTKKAFAK